MNDPGPFAADLKQLREKLGLSLNAMAELLYTSLPTYRNWEAGSRPRAEAAARIGRFITSAQDQLQDLEEHGINLQGLLPLSLASSVLGIPLETLFHAYRADTFQAHDLGILGLWVEREDVDEIMAAVLA